MWIASLLSNIDMYRQVPPMDLWADFLDPIARWVMFDRRGSGASDPVPEGACSRLEEWVDDVVTVMDAVEMERADLVASDTGTPMALLFAAMFPERVSRLVLFEAYACLRRSDDNPHGVDGEILDTFPDAWADHWGESWFITFLNPGHKHDRALLDAGSLYERGSMSPSVARATLKAWNDIDVRHVVPQVQAPVLLLHATNDRAFPIGLARDLGDSLRDATLVEYESRNHAWWLFDDPEWAFAHVREFLTGALPDVEPDRVLATVLFTDIVGSTDRAASMGDDRWSALLGRHDETAREVIDACRGTLVKNTGDGVLATFDGPGRAVRAARALVERIAQLGIEVRAGLHTGEIERRGDDVSGIAVHTAARVMSHAGASQVLVSRTVPDLVAGSGIEFADRGTHHLKGVPGEWQLYEVVA